MSVIRVFAKRPDSGWYTTNLSNNLKNLQNFVDGYIETVSITDGEGIPYACIVCNEEGRLHNLPYNCTIGGIDFVGDIFVCGVKDDEFCDVPGALKDWKEAIA